jgi:ribulose-5-phosphate 4-epimerase/fuculose-1-phosphate aldolase
MFRYCGATPEDWIVHFDFNGQKLAGVGTPPFEAAMYTEIMKRRPDVHAMVHCHAPACIALSLVDKPINTVHLQSSKFAGGVPFYPRPILIKDPEEGQELADALGPSSKAVIIKGHGIIAVGSSIDQACMNAVYLERTAKIQTMAMALGFKGPSQDFIDEILGSSRRRQGTTSVQERNRARGGYSNEWVYYKHKILQGERWTRGWS